MLVTVHVVLTDGREVDIARDVDEAQHLSPAQVLDFALRDGYLPLSDSEQVPLSNVARVEFAEVDAPAGPGWGPGLQDEDAASAAGSDYPDGGS
jgi:hypothetical protein